VKHVVADIETDGLLDVLTRIHCLVLRDVETGEVLSCSGVDGQGYHSITAGLDILEHAEVVYMHNGVRFDIPAIQKLYPWFKLNGTLRDTLIVAQFRWAHVKERDYNAVRAGLFPSRYAGSHALAAWGHRLGCHKGEYTDWCKEQGVDPWAVWRPEMQTYCEQDTEVTRQLVLKIRESGVSEAAVQLEHDLASFLFRMEDNGWPFDLAAAQDLTAKLAARREELAGALVEKFWSWEVPAGVLVPKRDNKKLGYTAGVPVQKYKTITFNPNSRQHIADRLKTIYGWVPTQFTSSGQAEISETTLDALGNIPEAALLHEFLMVQKRLGQIAEGKQAWLTHARLNPITGMHHIHGRIKQNAAVTHRAAHVSPNVAQVPAVGKPYGADCRALWRVPPGWDLVGCDMSGIELRCLAHYMARYDGGAYGKIILDGDIHAANRDALGLEGKAGRDIAKRFIYAFLYGAGDPLLGELIHKALVAAGVQKAPKGEGEQLKHFYGKVGKRYRDQFLKGLPALDALITAVKKGAKDRGYLLGLDGRRAYVRHEHASLNTLLQMAGALLSKKWLTIADATLTKELGPQGWLGKWAALAWIHDETESASRPEHTPFVASTLVDSIRLAGEAFNFRIRLDGEAKVGQTWRDVH
jgi:DNA polymerase-1